MLYVLRCAGNADAANAMDSNEERGRDEVIVTLFSHWIASFEPIAFTAMPRVMLLFCV